MERSIAFLPPFSTTWIGHGFRNVVKSHVRTTGQITHSRTRMIQRPDRDGPPSLEEFVHKKNNPMVPVGEPVRLATGRARLEDNENDVEATCLAALSAALNSLSSQPQLLHCSFSLDVDSDIVYETLQGQVNVPILGRTVNKKDSAGTIEILILSSDEDKGISSSSATVEVTQSMEVAARAAAFVAAYTALNGLASRDSCAFMVFCHTPGEDSAVREGLERAFPGVIAYGGPAAVDEVSGDGWALFGSGTLRKGLEYVSKTVHVAAVPGSLSFLYSAVIKTWVQPVFAEPLSYMTPSYVGDASLDLLTAIRYNDWDKFVWCIEEQDVDVNIKWPNKQNQSPLLAACSRARTDMIKYLLERGADVEHRNDSGYTALMYTRKLSDLGESVVLNQLKILEDAGVNTDE